MSQENDRRIGGAEPARPAPDLSSDAPKELPVWAIKMRQEYESRIAALDRKLAEMEEAAVEQRRAQRQVRENTALALYGEAEEVKGLTKRLTYLLPNAQEIGQQGVALVAQIAIAHGLDPLPGSDHVYAWVGKGRQGKELVVTIGYKGLLQLARQQVQFTQRSRPMTDDERAEHGVVGDEIGYVTELYEIDKAATCRAAGIPYHPIIGTAIWKPGNSVPKDRSPAWVAKKNSLKDALRQIASTGVRLREFLDTQFRADLDGFRQEGDEWHLPLPDGDDEAVKQTLIDEGVIPPDEDDDPAVIEGAFEEHREQERKRDLDWMKDTARVERFIAWATSQWPGVSPAQAAAYIMQALDIESEAETHDALVSVIQHECRYDADGARALIEAFQPEDKPEGQVSHTSYGQFVMGKATVRKIIGGLPELTVYSVADNGTVSKQPVLVRRMAVNDLKKLFGDFGKLPTDGVLTIYDKQDDEDIRVVHWEIEDDQKVIKSVERI